MADETTTDAGAAQDQQVEELGRKLVALLAQYDSPTMLAACCDLLLTIAAAQEPARPPIITRLRRLAATLELMPAGVPTQKELESFLTKVNAMSREAASQEGPAIYVPPGVVH